MRRQRYLHLIPLVVQQFEVADLVFIRETTTFVCVVVVCRVLVLQTPALICTKKQIDQTRARRSARPPARPRQNVSRGSSTGDHVRQETHN